MIISIDSGSSNLKLAVSDKIFCEPSLIEEVTDKSTIQERICVAGKWYVAGKRAEQQKSSYQVEPEISGNFHGSEKQMIQWIYAFEKEKLEGKHEVLITSLPYETFSDENIVNLIKNRKIFQWKNSQGTQKEITFDKVIVVPQGVGALALYQNEYDGKKMPRLLTLIDIGSCTTDIVSVVWDDEDQTYIYKEKDCISILEISTSVFIRRIRDKINLKRALPVDFGYHEIARAIQNNEFILQIGSSEVDFHDIYISQTKLLTSELGNKLSEILADSWRASNEVVLTGGGASFILPWECEKRTKRLDLFSNVRGQLLIGKGMI
jgi:hypothetical protein